MILRHIKCIYTLILYTYTLFYADKKSFFISTSNCLIQHHHWSFFEGIKPRKLLGQQYEWCWDDMMFFRSEWDVHFVAYDWSVLPNPFLSLVNFVPSAHLCCVVSDIMIKERKFVSAEYGPWSPYQVISVSCCRHQDFHFSSESVNYLHVKTH